MIDRKNAKPYKTARSEPLDDDRGPDMPTRILVSALAAACSMLATNALAEDSPVAHQPSRAIPLSDAQLDEITAGATTQLHVILNNGNADKLKFGDHLQCVNCFGGSSDGKAIHLQVITNPAQTIVHCSPSLAC